MGIARRLQARLCQIGRQRPEATAPGPIRNKQGAAAFKTAAQKMGAGK